MKLNNLLLAMSLSSEPVKLSWCPALGENPELTNLRPGCVIQIDGVPGVSLAVTSKITYGDGALAACEMECDIIIDNPKLEA